MTHPAPPPPTTPAAQRRRRLGWLIPVFLLAGLAGSLGWLGGSASGLHCLLDLASQASGDRLRVENPDGRLLGPLRIGRLSWRSAELQVQLDGLRLDWQPAALLDGRLTIDDLHADRLQVTSRSTTPPPLPDDLRLPLPVDIARLSIDRLDYGQLLVARDLAGRLNSDGVEHVLRDFRANLGSVTVNGEARLGGTAPLPLAAHAEITGQLADRPLALSLQAAGPLASIAVAASARQGLQGNAKIVLTPFAKEFFSSARLALDEFDPARWQAGAPTARLRLQADIGPSDGGIAGDFSLLNRQPGPFDHQRLPLNHLSGHLDWQGDTAKLDRLILSLPDAGQLTGSGRWQERTLHLDLAANRLDAAQLFTRLRPTRLAGRLSASLGAQHQDLKVDLKDAAFRLLAEASQAAGRLAVPRLELSAGMARLTAKGELSLGQDRAFSIDGELLHFDPSRFARLAAAQINASFSAHGKLTAQPLIDGRFALVDSRWAGQPVNGQGRLQIAWPHIPLADIALQAGPNHLAARGAFGRPGDRLQIELDAPQLAPYGLEGGLAGHLEVTGSAQRPQLSARLQAARLGWPGRLRANGLELTAEAGGEPGSPMHFEAAIGTLETPDQPGLLKQLHIRGTGSNQAHRIEASTDLAGRNHLTLAAEGGLSGTDGNLLWRGQLVQAGLNAEDKARNFKLGAPTALQLGATGWRIGPAHLLGDPLDWQATLQASADKQHLHASLSAHGSRLGHVDGELDASLLGAWQLDREATWQGKLNTDIADLGWLAELIGDQWQSAGHFSGAIKLAGRPANPVASGRFHGEKLALRHPVQGLDLARGELDVELANNRLRVVKFGFDSLLQAPPRPLRLAGGEAARLSERPGRLEISGEMQIDRQHGADQAFLDFHLDRLGAWQLPDQWVIVSGDGRLSLQDGGFGARGKLAVDAGYWQLAKSGTPRLSDDVVIRRPASDKPASLRPKLDIDIAADLGRNFLFNGAGLSARLAGDIRLRASGRDLPRASGSIHAVDGRFDAYGQQLSIERGILSFQGLLDNPALDVRAVRRGLAVEPGVQISGTARKPVVRLISDPELPDAEKLAWLVLGHGPEQMGAGDASVLLSAAGGLLGNDSGGLVQQLKKSFGVDELGVRTGQIGDLGGRQQTSRVAASSAETADSTGRQIFSVGKRLSSNALLSYEQALGKAESIVKLTISLSRRLSVVGRAGSDNAIDLFYTLTFGQPPASGTK